VLINTDIINFDHMIKHMIKHMVKLHGEQWQWLVLQQLKLKPDLVLAGKMILIGA
jgi:superoxide dismutase